MVSYQPDVYTSSGVRVNKDKFFHRYSYDAQNRLKKVFTSRDEVISEKDASYKYYQHGPLARTEYGQLRIQGIDYAYTLQGWIKGVNSTDISASGGSCPQGSALGSSVVVSDRAQYSRPDVYKAQQEIIFEPGFMSDEADLFETLIDPNSPVCVPGQGSGEAYAQGDMGQDGDPSNELTANVGRDVFGYALNYYNNDYKAIKPGLQIFANGMHNLPQWNNDGMITGAELFNGNIASMLVNIPKLATPSSGSSGTNPILYGYRYDQLNRIVGMNAYKNDPANTQPHTFSPVVMSEYKERVSYDPNGNILTYNRNGNQLPGQGDAKMDQLTYKYLYVRNDNTKVEYTPGQPINDPQLDHLTNQLASVRDAISDGKYTIDLDNQDAFNYEYDRIGNLIKDKKEGITNISWTVYGKIASITKDADKNPATTNDITTIAYTYDVAGNRISKTVAAPSPAATRTTVYVRDASGNAMSVYEKEGTTEIKQAETHLYGSSRLGMITERSVSMVRESISTGSGVAILSTFTRNEKVFELSNHLGNVLVTISDKKTGFDTGDDGAIDHYESDVVTANDYYPFGMLMPGRNYSSASGYRYGFNGKENDKDVKGDGMQYDYGFRIYNSRIGRFLSVDPLTKSFPELTAYQFASNTPIEAIDLDGLESESSKKEGFWKGFGRSLLNGIGYVYHAIGDNPNHSGSI